MSESQPPLSNHSSEFATREFIASDGYPLRFREWQAHGAERGIVIALHGIQSHSGWYGFTSARLAEAGWTVRFLDRRGSGLNAIDRGHAPHADRLVNDVVQFLTAARREDLQRPVVLLGLSWGGRLAACVAARRPERLDGLILLYPGICARVGPSWRQKRLLGLATRFDLVRRFAAIPLDDPALFTAEPNWQQFIAEDPLALHEATTGFFAASLQLECEALSAAARIACPTLMMLAGQDAIIDNAATLRWFARLASVSATLVQFPTARHTLEFEPCRAAAACGIRQWLETLPGREEPNATTL